MLRAALALAVLFVAPAALAQQAPAPATPPVGPDWTKINVTTTDLGGRTYMLSNGASGNVIIAVGDDGVIMIDGQHAPMHEKLKAAVAAVTPQPIKFLINTHIHGDHTGGNALFAKDGVTIVAHENVKKRLAAGTTSNLTGQANPPVAAEALPSRTYAGDSTTVEVKGRVVQLKHHPRAHTDGDTYIYFADANVLSTGDTFNNGRYQNSDWANGGNLKGMIELADAYLAISNEETKIVPGHGSLANKTQLREFRDMMATSLDRMTKLISDGKVKTEAEAIELKPFTDLDPKWAANEQAARTWIRIVYNSAKANLN